MEEPHPKPVIETPPVSANDPAPAYPGIGQAFALLGLFWLVVVLVGIGIGVVSHLLHSESRQHPAVQAMIELIAAGIILRRGLRRTGAPARDVLALRPVAVARLLPMLITVAGLGVVLSEADNALRLFFPPPKQLAEVFESLMAGRNGLWGSLLMLSVAAPIAEETVFRGLILRGFLSRYGIRKAIAISALLFGLFHLNPWQFLGAAALGALFAWWTVKTRSLVPCLLGHALNNGLPVLALQLFHLRLPGYSTAITGPVEFQPWWFDLAGLSAVALGLWWTRRNFGDAPASVPGEPETFPSPIRRPYS